MYFDFSFAEQYPIDNKSAFVQVMAWCWAVDKPLPEFNLI